MMVPTLNEDMIHDLSLQNQCMASSLLEEGILKINSFDLHRNFFYVPAFVGA
jgi:hypothetical protein